MEIRTNIELTNDKDKLQEILDQNRKIMKDLIKRIANEFTNDNHNEESGLYSIPKDHIENIRELLAKLTYYHRIEGEIKENYS